MGDVALRGEPGPDRADEARRLEVRADGAALCTRQRFAVRAVDQCWTCAVEHQIRTKRTGATEKTKMGEIDMRAHTPPW